MRGRFKVGFAIALALVAILTLTGVTYANTINKAQCGSPPMVTALATFTADEALATNVHVISDVVAATQVYNEKANLTTAFDITAQVATIGNKTDEQGIDPGAALAAMTSTNYTATYTDFKIAASQQYFIGSVIDEIARAGTDTVTSAGK